METLAASVVKARVVLLTCSQVALRCAALPCRPQAGGVPEFFMWQNFCRSSLCGQLTADGVIANRMQSSYFLIVFFSFFAALASIRSASQHAGLLTAVIEQRAHSIPSTTRLSH